MPHASQLPIWVSYLQALAVPILALVVAGFGAWISARQMLIAHDKLQLDAFNRQYERRIAVYEATRTILQSVFLHEIIPDNEIEAYGLHTLDAQFVFDGEMFKYLRDLRQRIVSYNLAKTKLAKLEDENCLSNDEKGGWEKIRNDNLQWVIEQGDEATGFATRFLPFLLYKQARRPSWLRWP